jgi:hypothetical protein
MNGPWKDAEEVRAGIESGEINWINVWWVSPNLRAAAIRHLQRMTPGPTGRDVAWSLALLGVEAIVFRGRQSRAWWL